MLWFVYRSIVPGLTASLTEVAPEIKPQLRAIPDQQRGRRRVMLLCIVAGLILLGMALVLFTGYRE
jgi:hypothetical protein